jgi:hypothetical protein
MRDNGPARKPRRPEPAAPPGARRTRLGLVGRVAGIVVVQSAALIVAFALLYALAHQLAPDWAFLATAAGQETHDIGDVLTFSVYSFFHAAAPLAPHGPHRVLLWLEFALSWTWLVLVVAWAIAAWQALPDGRRG